MRQAQNAKRVRGRGGRKVTNQMNRVMDSSGPDVKLRGTPSHIFEKYQTLARDANSAGDRIMAENYLQHAEHYLRVINALQAAANPAGTGAVRNADQEAAGDEAGDASAPSEEAPTKAAEPREPRKNGAARSASGRAPRSTNGRGRRRVTAQDAANGDAEANGAGGDGGETAETRASKSSDYAGSGDQDADRGEAHA